MNIVSGLLQLGAVLFTIVAGIGFSRAAQQAKAERDAELDRKMKKQMAEFEASPEYQTMLRHNPWMARAGKDEQ